tara:strand:+ start:79 stop:4230 length:4152 start_codon:yes stop_codon:yes gene_type:complete
MEPNENINPIPTEEDNPHAMVNADAAQHQEMVREATADLELTEPENLARLQAQQSQNIGNQLVQASQQVGNQINQAGQNVIANVQSNPQVQALAQQYGMQPQQPQPNILSETGAAIAGGAADAVESVGGFAELTGDTLKTGINTLMGRPIDQTQNPFSELYESGDAGWLDVPDEWVPENHTALGNLARGLVEFGILTAATGGVGGATFGGARAGVRLAATARAAGVGAKGTRYLKFITKAGKVAAEGATAELISSAGEDANLLNLVDETTPWMSPWLKNVIGVNALKVNPEDNPWLARIKTVAVGSGINLVGWGISAYAKGRWSALEARKQGKTIDEANDIGNARMEEDLQLSLELDERAATEKAADQWSQGNGISHADNRDLYLRKHLSKAEYEEYISPSSVDDVYARSRKNELEAIADGRGQAVDDIYDQASGQSTVQAAENAGREADPWVNPRHFNDSERALIRPDSPTPAITNIKQSVVDMKSGGSGRSSSALLTDAALKKMSRGDANLREYIVEVANDISRIAFKDIDNTLSYKDVQALIIRQASDMFEALDNGKNAADSLSKYFRESKDFNMFSHQGNEIVTGTATERAALQLVVHSLAKQAQDIATGAIHQAKDINITRQVEEVFDAMKVALTEHKKIGYMVGSELGDMRGYVLSPNKRKQIGRRLAEITVEQDEYFEALHQLNRKGRFQEMKDLMELHALSDGNVRTLDHIHTFLQAKLFGGDMGIKPIRGQLRTQLQSTFYNSILSSLKTPIDAVVSTVMIGTSRPMMQYVGAAIKNDKKGMAIATAGIDAIGRAYQESLDMALHNWDLGLQRKNMSYQGRYDVAGDIADWKGMAHHYEKYGTAVQKRAYGALDVAVNVNSSPWMKYSANAMGAGDAFTRTILGRVNMRMAAAKEVIEKGADLNDVKRLSAEIEENFRSKIFKKDQDGKWIVSDKATMLAGDEATMTKALEGWPRVFEEIQQVPLLRAFFPFVRTGVNALDLTFQSSPLAFLHKKYRNLKNGIHLDAYGLKPEDVAGELAMMEGRMAVGTALTSMAFAATMSGNMTGDYPYNKEGRDLWKAAGIQPYSIKVGNTWISYKELEPWNTVLSVSANMVTNADILGEDVLDNWTEKVAFMASAVLVDKSMLSGVKDLTAIFSGQTAERQLTKTASKYLRSHLPYAGLMGQLGNILDGNAKEAQTLQELIFKRDAFFKSQLPPKYDILSKDRSGKPLNLAAESPIFRMFNAFSPVAVVPIDNDPVKQTLVDMQYNLPEEMRHYRGTVLNSRQTSMLQKYIAMGDLRKRLEYVMKSRRFQTEFKQYKDGGFRESEGHKLSEQRFYMLVQAEFTRAKAIAWQRMLAENPDLRDAINARRIQASEAKRGRQVNLKDLQKYGF